MHRRFLRVGLGTLTLALLLPIDASAQDEAPVQGEAPAPDDIPADAADAQPGAPTPGASSVVSGRVTDKESGEPLPETTIDVIGTGIRSVTDDDGRFRIEVPPGTYVLRILAPGYEPIRVQRVIVYADGERTIDVALDLEEVSGAEEHVIEEAPDRASVEDLNLDRQKSAAAQDSIGRKDIAKGGDRNAAQAARRVVGVTIVGNRFVYVRGLGERYTNALLNGAPLPSPEPDRAAVPLDLFPTTILESLSIAKTFTPDVPADFAGGSVRIETRQIPSEPLFSVSISGAYNSQATFRERLNHRGSGTELFGFDSGTRDLSDEIPRDSVATADDTPEQNQARGRAINSFMSANRAFTPPNFGFNVAVGDAWSLGGDQKLGAIATLNYGRSFQIRKFTRRVLDPDPSAPDGLARVLDGQGEQGNDSVNWGAYGGLGYKIHRDHRLNLVGLHSQLADKATSVFQGFSRSDASEAHSTRLDYTSRSLDYLQLGGEHVFSALKRGAFDWFTSLSRAARVQPDTRNTVFALNASDPENPAWLYVDGSQSGQHFWSDQYENSLGAGANWTQPLTRDTAAETKVKLGGLFNQRTRNFVARRLALRRQRPRPEDRSVFRCEGVEFDASCEDKLFIPSNIGPNLLLEEGTVPQDAYDAELDIYAAYLMADVSILRDLRTIVGARVESTHQTIEPFNQFDPSDKPPGAELDSTDILPAVALVYSPTSKTKSRFSLTRTLARPQLRELAPFAFRDYFGGRRVSGNPNLGLTKITNLDMRFEYFPTLGEVLAFSVFYKRFTDPIEPVIRPSGDEGLVTFENADGANLIGVEFEARKDLAFLANELEDFAVISNLTLSRSRIELDPTDTQLTNRSRAMVHQAPYVLNLALDYTNEDLGGAVRASYNLLGPRIVEIGADGLDDAYEHERHTVDIVLSKDLGKHFKLALGAQNILNSEIVVTQGPDEVESRVISRYTEGALYTLSATYTY